MQAANDDGGHAVLDSSRIYKYNVDLTGICTAYAFFFLFEPPGAAWRIYYEY